MGRRSRALPVADLQERLEGYLRRDGELGGAVFAAREKIQTLADFWPLVGPIYDGPVDDPKAREQWLDEDGRAAVAAAREVLAEVSDWDTDHLDEALRRVVEQRSAKPKQVFQPIASRWSARRSPRASSRPSSCSAARRRSGGWMPR